MRQRLYIGFLAALLCAGCASTRQGDGTLLGRFSASRQLAQAETQLREGDQAGAVRSLEAICNGPSVAGVTDEALFRLALLTLKPKAERPASTQAQHLLKRLRKEFPESQWTLLAAPLQELVNAAEEQKRQNKALKGTNQALNREITELTQRIEQLKTLDQELEKKAR